MSDYDHTNPYTSGIRKGRARPRSDQSLANADNKRLHALLMKKSEPCPDVDQIKDEFFAYENETAGKKGVSGFPQDPSYNKLYINAYHTSYSDKILFTKCDGILFLKYQKQKNDHYNKSLNWYLTHKGEEVHVVTDSFGGRILTGTLEFCDKDKGGYLWIKVC